MALVESQYPGLLVSTETGAYAYAPDAGAPIASQADDPPPGDLRRRGWIFHPRSNRWSHNPAEAARQLTAEARAAAPVARASARVNMAGWKLNPFTGSWSLDPDSAAKRAPAMVEVSEAGVSQWRRDLVEDVLASILRSGRLAVPNGVEVRWYRPETDFQRQMREDGRGLKARAPLADLDERVFGFVNGHEHTTIWLRADAEDADLAEAAAHELLHVQTFDRALAGETEDVDDEAAALSFGCEIRSMFEEAEAGAEGAGRAETKHRPSAGGDRARGGGGARSVAVVRRRARLG